MAGSSRDAASDYYATRIDNGKTEDTKNGTITIQSLLKYRAKKTVDGKEVYDDNEDGSYKFDETKNKSYTYTYYRYYTENGQKASTTRNIYGVYDMAGGAWENMANSIEEGNEGTQADQIAALKKYEPKFATIYKGKSEDGKIDNGNGTTSDDGLGKLANYKANKNMYGDAIWETSNANPKGNDADKTKGIVDSDGEKYNAGSSWNNDYSNFPRRVYPFVIRGGSFYISSDAGVFSFVSGYGGSSYDNGFRVVAL